MVLFAAHLRPRLLAEDPARGPEDTAVTVRARDPPKNFGRRADSHCERKHAKDSVVHGLQVFGLKTAATKTHQALEYENHQHVAG